MVPSPILLLFAKNSTFVMLPSVWAAGAAREIGAEAGKDGPRVGEVKERVGSVFPEGGSVHPGLSLQTFVQQVPPSHASTGALVMPFPQRSHSTTCRIVEDSQSESFFVSQSAGSISRTFFPALVNS